MPAGKPFLTAEWLHLAMLNFTIDPGVLAPLVPQGTEIDVWQGLTFVSLVGFQFRSTRLWGISIPFHRNFAEVNLRFYVRRPCPEGWRRGVVFVQEFAPRRAVAWTARWLYGENYVTVPMRHKLEIDAAEVEGWRRAAYRWRFAGREHALEITATGAATLPDCDSEAEFVVDHYWGYSRGARHSLEYRVEHPRWRIRPTIEARFTGDAARLYGPEFAAALGQPPSSAFLVDGSAVRVYPPVRIASAAERTERASPVSTEG